MEILLKNIIFNRKGKFLKIVLQVSSLPNKILMKITVKNCFN